MTGAHPPARATLQVDDARVRITRYDFAPGEATGHHRHAYPYAVVPLTEGTLTIVANGASTPVPIHVGATYAREAGVEHDVVNLGPGPVAFVEIEFKT